MQTLTASSAAAYAKPEQEDAQEFLSFLLVHTHEARPPAVAVNLHRLRICCDDHDGQGLAGRAAYQEVVEAEGQATAPLSCSAVCHVNDDLQSGIGIGLLCSRRTLMCGLQELIKLRALRLGPGATQRPAAPADDDEWSTVGRRGAKTTTRGEECLAVRLRIPESLKRREKAKMLQSNLSYARS